ncbi:MAG: helix-turn-helix domain-containing protein [Bacteroidetes bacterium]|nr:helix-turn-helix domain-containing protein [Bacteroidota bacterium]MBT3934978.1 helix-turn-helix domain-containing protein [Bacteroidota bacterium]MBT4727452.1 helix-turn-helix domain-containing protein [Bacteroidota bacterium]
MEKLTNRIKELLESNNLNPSKLADQIGINRSRLSHILTGRNNPSLEIIQGILTHYPQINPDWLLSGEGQMYRNDDHSVHPEEDLEANKEPTNDLFSYKQPASKEISKSQPLEIEKDRSQLIENENLESKKDALETNMEKMDVLGKKSSKNRVSIKMVTILYDNNEYEILYPEK